MVHCKFDDDQQVLQNITDKLILARGYAAVGTLALSLVVFAFAFANLWRKYARFHKECVCCSRFLWDYFTNPFLLLALISILPLVSYVLILPRYSHVGAKNRLDDDFCKLPGYLLLWFESSETCALAVFSLYFLFYYIPFHNKIHAMLQPREYERVQKTNRLLLGTRNPGTQLPDVEYKARVPKTTKHYWIHSIGSVTASALIIVLCGLYTCPYFVKRVGPSGEGVPENKVFRYGSDDAWCWIKPAGAQKHFWFFEEWMYMGLSLVALLAAFGVLLCMVRSQDARLRIDRQTKWDKTILVPFGIFLTYFVVQFALMVIEILVRICHNSNDPLWFTYAIGKPLSKILLVVAALQLMSTSYRMGRKGETGGVLVAET